MSRRSKETLAVQLFPFLAVLVCTMGSLIFLLLVTTRQIRQRAVAFAAFQLAQQELAAAESAMPPAQPILDPEPEPEPEPPPVIVIPPQPVRKSKPVKLPDQDYALALASRERELYDLKTKWKLRVDQLAKERDGHRTTLARQKEQFSQTVDESESLKSEVERLENQLSRISGEAADVSRQSKDDEARRLLERQIAELKKQLKAAELAELTDSEKFQVVPFDPLTGTTRRPIFLECTEQGIRFLPEDITITAADLSGFTNRVNPLAAGTGALINYWIARNMRQRNSAAEPDPYVLLLVRPSGILAYYVAMKMLEPIRTQHGYELIDDSVSLQLPEIDPGAKAACQAAVNRLIAERENVFRSAMNTGGGGTVFGVSGRGGGSGSGRGSGSGSGPYSERMAGIRRGDGNLFTISDVMGDEGNERDSESWDPLENFKGRPPRRTGSNASRSGDDGVTDGSQNGIAQGTGRTSSSGGASLGGIKTFGPAFVDPPNGTSGGDATGKSGPDVVTADGSDASQGGSAANGGGAGGRSGGQAWGGSRKGRSNDSGLGSSGLVPEMPVGPRPGKKSGGTSDSADSSSDGQDGESPDGVAGATSGGQGGSGSNPLMGGTPASNMFSDRTSTASRQANGAKLSPQSGAPNRKSKPSSDSENKQLEPEMLSGRRWGFSEQGASIGFEREVRVEVETDKVVIAEKYVIPIKPGDTKQEMFEQFATSLDRYSHEWGRPPQGFFWTPRLKFIVKPEASAHYEQLNSMMTRAGMSSSHEFAKTAAKIEFGRENLAPAKPATKAANSPASGGNR